MHPLPPITAAASTSTAALRALAFIELPGKEMSPLTTRSLLDSRSPANSSIPLGYILDAPGVRCYAPALMLAAINYVDVLKSASGIELAVLLVLAAASAYSWALIAMKTTQLRKARGESVTFLDTFWKASRLDAIYTAAQKLDASPLSRVFRAGYEELSKLAQQKGGPEGAMSEKLGGIENVERALNRAALAEITTLEAHIAFLGTVGSTAPFVGLFGTVMGILGAFSEIADKGNATIATVAAPIGNALLATAAGLFAAIPAVIAYNSFVSRIKVFDTEMSSFSHDFLNIVKRHFFK
jgi:biopolymer transport protein TolQ